MQHDLISASNLKLILPVVINTRQNKKLAVKLTTVERENVVITPMNKKGQKGSRQMTSELIFYGFMQSQTECTNNHKAYSGISHNIFYKEKRGLEENIFAKV